MTRPDATKLGLALAGGGFRASLFHAGVLRRLAELDLLRRVDVLSTVSGGSIVGALYVLLLKRRFHAEKNRLARSDYIAIADELDRRLARAMRLNLRNALLWNPLATLVLMLTPHSLGRRMAHLYERYLYRGVVDDLRREGAIHDARPWWQRAIWPGRIRLSDIRIPWPRETLPGGIDAHNRREAARPDGCAATSLVVNATALNSGQRFWFSAAEVGDAELGYVRRDEAERLVALKGLVADLPEDWTYADLAGRGADPVVGDVTYPLRTVLLALWLRDPAAGTRVSYAVGPWKPLFDCPAFPGPLAAAEPGLLRQAKLAAWYVRIGSTLDPPVRGGLDEEGHMARLWAALGSLDEALARDLETLARRSATDRDLVLDFFLELYALRSAPLISPRVARDWERLTLGDAVGASACFPPVFPPMTFLGIYDDAHVARLGLTDGGVFDNMGITALLDAGCTHIIASDTSGVFERQQSAGTSRLSLLRRLLDVLTKDLAAAQRSMLRERRRVSRALAETIGRGLAYFHIDSEPVPGMPGLALPVDRGTLARLRTDLDGFGDAEIAALVNQGYATADAYVRASLPDLKPDGSDASWDAPLAPPRALPDPARLHRILRAGRHRFFRALRLGAALSWIWTLAVVGVVVWLAWRFTSSPSDLAAGFPRLVAWFTVWDGWITVPAGRGLLAVLALGVLWAALKALEQRKGPWRRALGAVSKWGWGCAGVLLFFFGPLPLIIAGGAALYAGVNWLFFHRPFLARTAVDAERNDAP